MEPDSGSKIQNERLELLYELSQAFNSTLDLDEVLDLVMDEVIRVMKAERGFLMLVGDDGGLEFKTARGLDHSTISDPEFQISRGIVERVAREGNPLLTSDASLDSRFSDRQSVVSLGLRSILCVPLKNKGRVAGVIYVDNRLLAGIFVDSDRDLLAAIAANAAIAIENARLYQIAVEKGRMERELQMASQVQESLLPRELPALDGWEFAARWIPALEVAGDYYDAIPSDDGKVYVLVGDVTDKGMPASLFMVFTRSAVRASLESSKSVHQVVERSNRLLCLESDQGLFVTLFLGRLDSINGTMDYVNAGHNPALFMKKGADNFEHLIRTGIPIGIEVTSQYDEKMIQFDAGDLLILYSDGIPEAINSSGEQYGMARFEAAVRSAVDAPLDRLVDSVLTSVGEFSDLDKSFDDITLLAIRRSDNSM